MNEDDLINSLIRWKQEDERKSEEQGLGYLGPSVKMFPQAHYRICEDRDFADLYIKYEEYHGHLFEIISEPTVRRARGAYEIVRRFNQLREFFYDGSSHTVPTHSVEFELCFTPTENNVRHLIENAEMYATSIQNDLSGLRSRESLDVHTAITMRYPDPEEIEPVKLFHGSVNPRLLGDIFLEAIQRRHTRIYEEITPTISELLSE